MQVWHRLCALAWLGGMLIGCGTIPAPAPVSDRGIAAETASPGEGNREHLPPPVRATEEGVGQRDHSSADTTAPPAAADREKPGEGNPRPGDAAPRGDVTSAPVSEGKAITGGPGGNRAVVALAGQAAVLREAGDYARASARLERALRIEPRNPHLWHGLAQIKLDSGHFEEVETLARKSASLTSEPGLKRSNWLLVADARSRLGDLRGAAEARSIAQRIP